jgi:thiosulfate dehydrogenase
MRHHTRITVAANAAKTAMLAALLAGCTLQEVKQDATATAKPLGGWRPDAWTAPNLDSVSTTDPIGRSIRRGHALIARTRDSLPAYVGGNLSCTSCHQLDGRKPGAIPLFGVAGMYPRYNARADAVVSIEDRVNYCFTRSLAGWRLPNDSREMLDIVAYLTFLARGVPTGSEPMPVSLPKMPDLRGDSARGVAMFAEQCAKCHAADGAGTPLAPALWGPQSFSIGASMAREERAASFIRANMPHDKAGTLTDQQAYDVAAYITSQPRPDMPGKELDWPKGDAPADVPYATAKHAAAKSIVVFPRKNPGAALVPVPVSAKR